MKYKRVVVTQRGGPEVLQVVEQDLRAPRPGEARIKVLAASVSADDVGARYGNRPFVPKVPFTPGYTIIGEVEALGRGVTGVTLGDRVAALMVFGGYAEYVYLKPEHLAPTPATLEPMAAVPLVLNYMTAYQMLHRVARVKVGAKALSIGASGGVGLALLQLGKLAGLTLYGTASQSKHRLLTEQGAIPIDYRTQDFVQVIRQAEPDGLDVVFDGVGGANLEHGLATLRQGGQLITYSAPTSNGALLRGVGWLILFRLRAQPVKIFGVTALYNTNKRLFMEDWAVLCKLLAEGKIRPVIAQKFPLLEAAQANALLESGQAGGYIVLAAPELL